MSSTFYPPLSQIAFSVIDLRRTEAWFREGLGFLSAGGDRLLMGSPIAGRVQGLSGAASCAWWMVGRNQWSQFELFQFRRPLAKLLPTDFRACDIGPTRLGVHVFDFDAALANLARLGSEPLTPPMGEPGNRRACVRSPDGFFVEIMEDDPLPLPDGSERADCPVAVRSVTVSTPDLEALEDYLTAVGGREPEEIALHTPEHEALWGLPGATCKRAVFRAGDILIEAVQYLDPVGTPRPQDHRICDQGILNIAYGARNKADHTQVYKRAVAFGVGSHRKPFHLGGAGVVYMEEFQGLPVEIMWMKPGKMDMKYGFEPLPYDAYPQPDNQLIEDKILINAPAVQVWEVLNDQDSMSQWCGFDEVEVIREGQTSRHGVGSERRMRGAMGKVVEQITNVEPERSLHYRVIDGAPFHFHRGEITLHPQGEQTEVHWRIGFRGKLPLMGGVIRRMMQPMLSGMLENKLKPYIEGAGN